MMIKSLSAILALCLSTACANSSTPVMPDNDTQPLAANASGVELQLVDAYGSQLPTYGHRGGVFVEGVHGRRYNARLVNHTHRRVEVVVTVDGRDVLNGKPGDFDNRGYIIDPHGQVTIEGFRQSMSDVAAFRFTDPGDSYSARMGSPQNVGVVGAAVFFEEAQAVAVTPRPAHSIWGAGRGYTDGDHAAEDMAEAAPSPKKSRSPSGAAAQRSNLGTQYGERQHAPVVEARFVRADSDPAAVLAVYYDNRAGLIARGVVQPSHWASSGPQPFPRASRQFAPAPPR